ncbi:hypothetical protein CKAH01_13394 [Colletotrichum kahawae]|uniref:Secreted protein n=1 Tax=Colletotrichum kahawae TaxID=34407 RepID=A0AAD9YQY3_COLKA|nr:hypothetical protein CKAH01_13394 [Colletotrichum kahawae]
MKAILIAVALANAAIVLGGVYKGYICIMPNGVQNSSDNICWGAYGTPLPGSPGVCCISNSITKQSFDDGCGNNGGKTGILKDC